MATVLFKLELNVAVDLLAEISKHICYSLPLFDLKGSVSNSKLTQKLFYPIRKFLITFDFNLQLSVFFFYDQFKLFDIVR
jgi:hypothetical protein